MHWQEASKRLRYYYYSLAPNLGVLPREQWDRVSSCSEIDWFCCCLNIQNSNWLSERSEQMCSHSTSASTFREASLSQISKVNVHRCSLQFIVAYASMQEQAHSSSVWLTSSLETPSKPIACTISALSKVFLQLFPEC